MVSCCIGFIPFAFIDNPDFIFFYLCLIKALLIFFTINLII